MITRRGGRWLLVPSPAPLVSLLVLMVANCPRLLLTLVRHRLRHPVHCLRLQHVILIRGHRFHPIVDDLLGCDLSAINNSGGGGGGPGALASCRIDIFSSFFPTCNIISLSNRNFLISSRIYIALHCTAYNRSLSQHSL